MRRETLGRIGVSCQICPKVVTGTPFSYQGTRRWQPTSFIHSISPVPTPIRAKKRGFHNPLSCKEPNFRHVFLDPGTNPWSYKFIDFKKSESAKGADRKLRYLHALNNPTHNKIWQLRWKQDTIVPDPTNPIQHITDKNTYMNISQNTG